LTARPVILSGQRNSSDAGRPRAGVAFDPGSITSALRPAPDAGTGNCPPSATRRGAGSRPPRLGSAAANSATERALASTRGGELGSHGRLLGSRQIGVVLHRLHHLVRRPIGTRG